MAFSQEAVSTNMTRASKELLLISFPLALSGYSFWSGQHGMGCHNGECFETLLITGKGAR